MSLTELAARTWDLLLVAPATLRALYLSVKLPEA